MYSRMFSNNATWLVVLSIGVVVSVSIVVQYTRPAEPISTGTESGPWQEVRRFQAHGVPSGPDGADVTRLAFNSDGSQLASTALDKKIRLWQLPEVELLRTMTVGNPAAAFGPNLKRIAITCYPVQEFQFPSGRFLRYFAKSRSLTYSPDGKILAVAENPITGDGRGRIDLWRVTDGSLLHTLRADNHYIKGVAFSPNSKYMASGEGSGILRLWSVADGKVLHSDQSVVGHLEFSPDGKLLASGGKQAGGISVWPVPELKLLRKWHTNPISDLAFSPDGKLLAVCSWSDNIPYASLHLVRVSDGKRLQTLVDAKTTAECVAFHPDGNLLAAGMSDGTIRFFRPRGNRGRQR